MVSTHKNTGWFAPEKRHKISRVFRTNDLFGKQKHYKYAKIVIRTIIICYFCCRSPHGERGFKIVVQWVKHKSKEVAPRMGSVDSSGRRYRYYVPRVGRSPHGERGFKLHKIWIQGVLRRSLPAWGAWIQVWAVVQRTDALQSLPAWGTWIQVVYAQYRFYIFQVVFVSGALIPIDRACYRVMKKKGVFRMESDFPFSWVRETYKKAGQKLK